jgi:hypothetical protein
LELTLLPEAELRKATIPLFYDLIDCEFAAKGNFKQVRNQRPFSNGFFFLFCNPSEKSTKI